MSTFRPPPECPPDSEPTLPSVPSPALPYRASTPVYEEEPDPFPSPRCVFCGLTVDTKGRGAWEARTQVVHDGFTEHGTERKRAGRTIYAHGVCGRPEGFP